MIEQMHEILTALTEEAQTAAINKCQELGFDMNRGLVSLNESFINLNAARSILIDAIEKEKLIQLPITIQQNLLNHLTSISSFQQKLIDGSDEVVNLATSIEKLNTAVWNYNLHNLSSEVLGYHKKLNQLKKQELTIKELRDELEIGLESKNKIEQYTNEAQTIIENFKKMVATSDENTKKIAENLSQTTKIENLAAAKLTTIQQNENTTTNHLVASKASNAEIKSLEEKIKEFYAQINQYKLKITETEEEAKKTVQNNKTETSQLVSELRELENQIKDQIIKATGHSLFHSFQTRQETLVKSKQFWGYALGAVLSLALIWSLWLQFTTDDFNRFFYLKLSLSLPLIYAITFCTMQYSHERRLEEEYAFKSNISISLIPYQELVEKLVSNKPEEVEKYTSFIIDSINKVFASPTDKVFDKKRQGKESDFKILKQVVAALEPILKMAK